MALHKSSRLLSVGELAPLAAGAFSSWSFCRSRSHRPLFDRHSISVLAVHLDPMDGVAEDVLAGDARVARHVISCRSLKKDVVTSSVLIRLLVQLVDRLLDELIAATKVKAAALDVALKGLFLRQFSPCLLRNPLLDLCGVFRGHHSACLQSGRRPHVRPSSPLSWRHSQPPKSRPLRGPWALSRQHGIVAVNECLVNALSPLIAVKL